MNGLRDIAGPSFGSRSDASCRFDATESRDLIELRLLIELTGLRRLAERGFSDQELAVVRELAEATLRPARTGDILGYRKADMVFHMWLQELTGDPALSEIARLVLAPGRGEPRRRQESTELMAAAAYEHCELVSMLGDDMLSAADDLLRHHISGPPAGRPAAERCSPTPYPLAPKDR
jgi:DNA-binding GntR family transcriptional regulator